MDFQDKAMTMKIVEFLIHSYAGKSSEPEPIIDWIVGDMLDEGDYKRGELGSPAEYNKYRYDV